MAAERNIWYCKIGENLAQRLPLGADAPMRQAIAEAYRRLTGCEPNFIFSGWGQELNELERSIITEDEKRKHKGAHRR